MISSIRYLDTVGRWSENEFLIICPETNIDQVVIVAQHLMSVIEGNNFFFVGNVKASFGATECHTDDTDNYIMDRAYKALYTAKANGKNRIELV